MALDALLMSEINATKSEMLAAQTQEEASRIWGSAWDGLAANAEVYGWTGEDLAYAYNCFRQVYEFWKPPAVAEDDRSQAIAFQPSDLPDQNSNQVTISQSGGTSFFNEGAAAITNGSFMPLTKQTQASGKVVVALGFGLAGFGLALLIWRAIHGGVESRAW